MFSVEGGSSDLDTSVKGVSVGSGLVSDWVKNVNSLWVTEELGTSLDKIETIWVLFWLFGSGFWIWLLNSNVWLIAVFWSFIGSPVSCWVNHSFYGNVNIWSDFLIGNVFVLSKAPLSGLESIVVEWLWSSFPVKSLNFIVDKVINVWFNSWLGDVFLLGKVRYNTWWGVGISVDWISG